MVDRSQIAASDFEDRIRDFVKENLGFATGKLQAVLEVGAGLVAGKQREGGEVGEASSDGLGLLTLEQELESGVPGENDREDEARVEVEVGEDP